VAFVLLVLAAILAVVGIVPSVDGQIVLGGFLIVLCLLAGLGGERVAL
jgi:hypothetical protein